MASSTMSGYVDCIFNLYRPASATECLMYKISLVVLELLPVEVVVLVVWKGPEVRDVGATSGGVLFDL